MKGFEGAAHNRERGRLGEEAAARWLGQRGYRSLERNVRTRAGEIDLVAQDGETLCFVEIKARTDRSFGPAVAAVTPAKQRRLARAAALHLAVNPWHGPVRFDVLGLERDRGEWRFELIQDAFRLS
jgi:putative endonuclease